MKRGVSILSMHAVLNLSIFVLILTAAFSKIEWGGVFSQGWYDSGFSKALGVCELAFLCWYAAAGRRGKAFGGAALFSLFALVSAWEYFVASPSCGCFGSVTTSPRYILAADVIMVVACLGSLHCVAESRGPLFVRLSARLAVLLGIIASGIVVFYVWTHPPDGDRDGPIATPMQLLQHLDITANISHGSWLVLFYRPGCEDCASALAGLQHYCDAFPRPPQRLALVSLSPPSNEQVGAVASANMIGRLQEGFEPVVETPLLLELQNGIVRETWDRAALGRVGWADPEVVRAEFAQSKW